MKDQEQTTSTPNLKRIKLAIIAPTPFYYQVPMFRTLAANPRIDLKVYYCSDEGITGKDVPKKFHAQANWGMESNLLEGYESVFLKNYSPWPSYLTSLFGLMNLGVWHTVASEKPDVVILMSWMNSTWWLAILACLWAKIPFLYLTDQNVQRDLIAPKWKIRIKQLVLGKLLFRMTAGFLFAGSANRQLYKYYGVPDHKLVPFAFSWGYDNLLNISDDLLLKKSQIKSQLGIPEDQYVVLYCGRLSAEKNPALVLEAFSKIDRPDKTLLFVGDGLLRKQLEAYVSEKGITSVRFMGFQTRPEIPKYYAVSDVLVVPSIQETWGIVVNEAMCFGLPLVISDQVGAVPDLVSSGRNGFKFPSGDADALASIITGMMDQDTKSRSEMGSHSRRIIEKWAQKDLAGTLEQYYDRITGSDGLNETGQANP